MLYNTVEISELYHYPELLPIDLVNWSKLGFRDYAQGHFDSGRWGRMTCSPVGFGPATPPRFSHLYCTLVTHRVECSSNWLQPAREESFRFGGEHMLWGSLSWWPCSYLAQVSPRGGGCKQLGNTYTLTYTQIFIPSTHAGFHSSALTSMQESATAYSWQRF